MPSNLRLFTAADAHTHTRGDLDARFCGSLAPIFTEAKGRGVFLTTGDVFNFVDIILKSY